jgi:hypothetical protein
VLLDEPNEPILHALHGNLNETAKLINQQQTVNKFLFNLTASAVEAAKTGNCKL